MKVILEFELVYQPSCQGTSFKFLKLFQCIYSNQTLFNFRPNIALSRPPQRATATRESVLVLYSVTCAAGAGLSVQ